MAGFVLGTGSGILAAAAVYYTLSADLARQTASLRGELSPLKSRLTLAATAHPSLAASSRVLSDSFDPQTPPPAASSLIGPSRTREPTFSETLRSRWNRTIANTFNSIRTTDFAAAGGVLVESGSGLLTKLGKEVGHEAVRLEAQAVEVGEKVKRVGEEVVQRVEAAKDARDAGGSDGYGGLGIVGAGIGGGVVGAGDVRAESFTGGPGVYVRAKREGEKATGRLV